GHAPDAAFQLAPEAVLHLRLVALEGLRRLCPAVDRNHVLPAHGQRYGPAAGPVQRPGRPGAGPRNGDPLASPPCLVYGRRTMLEATPILRNFWYLALAGARLPRGAMRTTRLAGEPLLLCRGADGRVFALRDICPHRGIPLSYGRFDGREVECCYHGWRFAADGRCTAIPSLVPGQDVAVERIRCGAYPCCELQGNIWVYLGDKSARPPRADAEGLAQPPE